MTNRRQYLIFGSIALAVFVMTAVLMPLSRQYFQRFYGEPNPLMVVIIAAIVGTGCLRVLQTLGGFQIVSGQETLKGIGRSARLATLLAAAVIVADIIFRYPEDTNVPMPQALLFYPAIGLVAEIVFHLLPLALLLLLLAPLRTRMGSSQVVWLGIILTAVAEPTFQVLLGGEGFSWTAVYSWVQVFAIAFLQLYVFRRYDFASMYAFRLIYYGYWHIVWGVIRLEVLF